MKCGRCQNFRAHFARDCVYGPLNLQHVSTPMMFVVKSGEHSCSAHVYIIIIMIYEYYYC